MAKLPTITIDPEEMAQEMLLELGLGPDDPGLTTSELAQLWGVSDVTARRRVARLKAEGKIVEGSRTMRSIEGNPYPRRVIRLKTEEERR